MARRTQEEEVLLKLTQQVSGPAAQVRVAGDQMTESITGSVGALKAMQDAARVQSLGALESQIVAASGKLKELQQAMRELNKGKVVDVEQYRALKGQIDQQQAALAKLKGEHSALSGFAKKAGAEVAGGAKKGAGGMDAAAKAARLLGGSSAASAVQVIAFGKELMVLGPYALAAGASIAILAAGIVALVGFFMAGLKASDAFRNELLKLQGTMRGNAQAGKEAQAAINAVAGSAFNALPREKLAEYANQLGAMRLRGKELQVALEGAAIAGAAQGDAAAQAFIGGAAAARQFAGGVDALTARIRRQLGGVAASQAFSLDAQFRRMREDLTLLFGGTQMDPFLSGLKNITSMFGQNTDLGQKLQATVGSVFGKMLELATRALPFVKGAMLGVVIAVVQMYIIAKTVYNAIRDWASPIIKATGLFDDAAVAIGAAETAAYILTGVFVTMGAAVAIALLPITVVLGAIGLLLYVVVKAVQIVGQAAIDAATWLVGAFVSARDALAKVDLVDIGKNMVRSFIDSITGSVGEIRAAFSGMGEAAKSGLKAALGIRSPSRFAIETADNVTGTFTGRVDDAASEAQASLQSFADPQQVKTEAKAARASGGAKIVYIEIGAGGGGDRRGLLEELRAMLREELDTEATILEAV